MYWGVRRLLSIWDIPFGYCSVILCFLLLGCIVSLQRFDPIGYFLWIILLILVASYMQSRLESSRLRSVSAVHSPFQRSFLTCVCAGVILFLFLIIGRSFLRGSILVSLSHPGGYLGMMVGWLITPLVTSLFRIFFHSMQLRPGIDRHLHEDEGPT